jgi:ankyrin repeat protein
MGEKEAKEFHQNIKNAALDIALQLYQTQSSKRDKIFELIKASLEIGAEPANIITVCYFAESFELAKLLLQYGADPNENPALLNTAVIHNRADLVELFLEYKIDIHQQTDNGLRTACEYGKYKIAEMLLKAGAKVSVLTQEPIRSASRYGHAEVVKLLLKYGANPRVKNKQALEWARKGEHTEVVEILEEWFEKEDE